ncbi:membrane protein [Streptomyces phage Karp]|nr:membrane protein [Streptomyces phage Karp]
MNTAIFWIYIIPVGIGLVAAFFIGLLNGAFTGDYSSSGALATLNMAKAFFLVAVLSIVWPVSVPIMVTMGLVSDWKQAKRNAEYEARLAEGLNYGKVYRITESHDYLSDRFKVGHLLKVVKWDEEKPYMQAVNNPIPGYPMSYRFYWSLDQMEEI